MTPGKLSKRVGVNRVAWVEEMLERIRALPLRDKQTFLADPRNVGAAESYLRREIAAWEAPRNEQRATVERRFITSDARET